MAGARARLSACIQRTACSSSHSTTTLTTPDSCSSSSSSCTVRSRLLPRSAAAAGAAGRQHTSHAADSSHTGRTACRPPSQGDHNHSMPGSGSRSRLEANSRQFRPPKPPRMDNSMYMVSMQMQPAHGARSCCTQPARRQPVLSAPVCLPLLAAHNQTAASTSASSMHGADAIADAGAMLTLCSCMARMSCRTWRRSSSSWAQA